MAWSETTGWYCATHAMHFATAADVEGHINGSKPCVVLSAVRCA